MFTMLQTIEKKKRPRKKKTRKKIKIKQHKVHTKLITLQDENSLACQLDEHLTDDDIKRSKEDIETEICSYSSIGFLHKYQHKSNLLVQRKRHNILCEIVNNNDNTLLYF